MEKWFDKNLEFLLILFVALVLFSKVFIYNLPFGLDAIGHLSKISYLKEFGFVNWDMSWYSGTLFLKLYPPLFYYLVSLFPNVFFGSNLVCFLSLVFSSVGIYLLLKYMTENKKLSLIFSLSFFTILSISYYWLATANLPYFSAIWTIPFSLYFLEKSLKEEDRKYFIFFSIVFFIAIITHVITGFLIGLFMVLRFLFEGINFKNIKKIFIYGGIPVLISSFWFLPFLSFSNSSIGYEGYVPQFFNLFGFGDSVSWGIKAGGIGIMAFVFVASLLFFIFHLKKQSNKNKYYFVLFLILGFLLMGGLSSFYPYGVDPVRFILPFSILGIIFSALVFNNFKFFKKKNILFLFLLIIFLGILWNFFVINQNIEKYNYSGDESRYGIFLNLSKNNFPIDNNFSNYRFGTSKYIFGENLNYFMPFVSQTFGYQDVGMLNEPRYYDMRWHIWLSEDINDSFYWLDWFGIKYFEVEQSEVSDKFVNNSYFNFLMEYNKGYNFVLYEYLEAKPIISLVDDLEDGKLGKLKNFSFERNSPDEIFIYYDELDSNDVIVFKEFYFENWKAKNLDSMESLEVYQIGPGFMGVFPPENSKGVKLYYSKSFVEYFGIFLTFLGILFLFLVWKGKINPNIPSQKS